MESFYDSIVEPDDRSRLQSSASLEKILKDVAAVPCQEDDSGISKLALSERSITDDWLNTVEDEARSHLQQGMQS